MLTPTLIVLDIWYKLEQLRSEDWIPSQKKTKSNLQI